MRVAVAALVLAGLVLVPGGAAKEGVLAELTSTLPLAAPAGSTIDVSWSLSSPSGPFNAMNVYVHLLGRGGQATEAAAFGAAHPDGRYTASARVPPGGIAGIRIGLKGTTEIFFPVINDPTVLKRPLHLPALTRGTPCPVSHVDQTVDFHSFGIAAGLGNGPVYPIGLESGTLTLAPAVNFGSKLWAGQKVLWFVLPSYTGPVLIRGGRLDPPGGDLRFERGSIPSKQLLIDRTTVVPAGSASPPAGTRYRPSYTRVKGPGCYAYQIDGATFSEMVVFRAVRP
jgi:hypothetical protein